jgi:SAM-dependent methyltransferase
MELPPQVEWHDDFGVAMPKLGWVPAPRYLLRRDRVLRIAREMPTGRLLEVGCGVGALLFDFERMGMTCSALETSPRARSIAKELFGASKNTRIFGDPDIAWKTSFDYVAAFEVLEHIEDDAAALHQWSNWLVRRGKLILSVPADPARWGYSDIWAGHFRRYDAIDLVTKLESCGFKILSLETYGYPVARILESFAGAIHYCSLKRMRLRDNDNVNREVLSSNSGTDRILHIPFYRFLKSRTGRNVMLKLIELQNAYLSGDRGTGYLVVAEKT